MRRISSVKSINAWNRRLSMWGMLSLLGLSLCWWGWRSAQAVTNTWTIKAPMPTRRSILAAAEIGGKLYAAGGDNGSTTFATLEVYDPATDTWTSKADMPAARGSLAAAAINGKLYTVGGFDVTLHYTNTLAVYDPATNTWATKANMPTTRGSIAAAAINGKLYVVGGYLNGNGLNTLEVYDPATNTWATKANMPTGRYGLAAAALDGLLYVVGGETATAYSNALEVYDPATNTWATKANLPTARSGLVAGAITGKLYAAGGNGGAGKLDIYDPATNTWASGASLADITNDAGAAVVNNKFYLAGGFLGSYLNTLQVYDPIIGNQPTIGNIANQTIGQNGTTGALGFIVGDVETPAASLSVTGNSSNTTMVPNANIVFGGSGANRTVTVTPAANRTGATIITITVTDGNDNAASDTFTLIVNDNTTTTTITNAASLSATPTVVGQAYTVNASVTGAGTPTGTITVSDGSQICTITLPATSCNLTSISPGAPKTITATYNGDANFSTSSGTASHTVNKANTTTAITNAGALGTATVVGQVYSVGASVSVTSPGAGTPSGTITVSDGAAACTITLPATSCNLTSTTAGAKTIAATYNGDTNFNGSTSSGATHTVSAANTTAAITNAATLASTPSAIGQAVAINWSVTVNAPGAVGPALTGNVTISDGTQSCTAAVSAGTCSITFTTAGTKTLVATYAGDANYNGDTSANATHTVNATTTTTTITNAASLSGTPTVVGQAYAVNVSVTAASGSPTGTVTVSDGSQTCTITLPATSCNLTSTSPGAPKTITATNNGDANFSTSSGSASHTVNKASTTTAITNAAALGTATVVGQAYSVAASVSINSPGTGTPSGTIMVSDGSATCTITLPATSCNLTSTTVGAKTITATYNGDTNFNSDTSSGVPHTVNSASTTTAITNAAALATATVVGQAYSVAASVSVTSPGAGTPTGTITVSDGSATCTITLPATSCNLASTTAGAKTITATYNGDANFNSDASSGLPHTVNKANTTTTITNAAALSSTPSTGGQAVAINWSVAVNAPGALGAALTGNVTISDGTQSCTAAVGAGTCSITFNTAGTKTLTATYAGDANYNGDTSANATHTVNTTPTTTTITNAASLSGTPTVVGQAYSVNVSVTAAAGTPTGTITVSDGAQTCTITLPAAGCNLTSSSPGAPKTITATYNGDADFGTSSGTASHTVNKASTMTAVTNAAALGTATVVGQAYSVAASVSVTSPGAGTPSGTITVSDGSQTCTITLPATSCNLTSTSAGAKTITATYNGDANFNGGASSGVPHTVNAASTMTAITSDNPDSSTIGQSVVVNFTVTANAPGGGAPTGNVVVTVSGGAETCTGTVAAGTCTITLTSAGARTLTATYAGNGNYQGSADTEAHTVNAAATTTAITNAASLGSTQTVVGQAYTVNVSVTATPPASGTPTGTVTVSDGSQTCTVTLPATSCNLTSTTAGAKTISATYNGDADFSSSFTTASHTVNKANSTLGSLTDSPDPSVTGQAYTVGFTLSVTSPGAGTPTGTVMVSDGTGGSCTATLPATSCSLTSTTVGTKTLTFTYNGDTNFNNSINTAGHQVNKANTTTMITADTPEPSVFGANVVVNFSVVANSPGGGAPAGNVVITASGGAETCTGTVAAGTCTLALTALGNRTLTATYAGDDNFNGSTDTEAHTVNKADTTLTIASDNPDSSAVGQNVTVAFTVVATSPGAGTPSGNVVVTVSGGAETCTGTVAAGSCVITLTTPGARTLTANYAGDANFNGSSDTESHSVVAPPSIAKAFAPASTPVGGMTTLTLTITNPASNSIALTGVSFTDTFPAGLAVATPLVMNNTCGGTLTDDTSNPLIAGAPGIKLSGGSVGVSPTNTCTVSVKVTPTVAGPFNNVTGNVTSINGGTGNTASATLLTNTAPTIGSNTIAPQAGSSTASLTIATAVDPDQPVNTLGITINGNPATASSNGVTVSGVTIAPSGTVTATISTTCAAASTTFTLAVTDNENAIGMGTLTINVQPNQPPVLSYANQTVTAGTTPTIAPMAGPSDNGTITSLSLQSVTPNNGGLTVSANAATGQVQVTSATIIGNYAVAIALTDNCGATATARLTINVVCPTIGLIPASLSAAPINTAYSQTISASPAGGNYSFAVTSGLLPAGLTLNGNGSFSGAPTQSGTFNFRITATGFGGCIAFQDYSLVVTCPAIAVTPASLPGGSVGTAYNQTVTATPAGNYTYSVTSGALPLGLTLNASSGAITGTPATTGSSTFTITAAAGACSNSRSYTVAIGCATISFSPASPLPGGQAGVAYNQTIGVSPSGSYTLSLISGSLPSGMTLNPTTGILSGTPTTTGSFSFTIRALAGNGCDASQSYTLAIICPAVALTPASLPNGSLGTAYNQAISAAPAGGNYTYAVTSGSLPTGLNLNQATGSLTGTPTVSGTFSFRITATGFGICAGSRDYTLVVGGSGCPTITLADLPNGAPGQFYSASAAASPSGSYSYAVTSGSLPPGLTLFGSVGLLYGYPTMAGIYNFTVTATDVNNCTGSKSYAMSIGGAATASLVFGDFDGDGKADLSVWRGSVGDWLTVNSRDGKLTTEAWGTSASPYNDVMAPGDYDGDGKMDLAVFRRGTGEWLIKGSKNGAVTARVWGLGTDLPVPGDYDGDGKTDLAVWRGADSNWYILRSSDGQTEAISWGTSRAPYRDAPVAADYDGDGKTDVAVFRQSNGHWYIRLSSSNEIVDKAWGLGTDVPVAADYDGDGKADIAVWRGADSNWYIVRSSDSAVQTISCGASSLGDVPVPGDYDGDGKADAAVWREFTGMWYVKRSSDGTEMSKAHGQSGDVPTVAKRSN